MKNILMPIVEEAKDVLHDLIAEAKVIVSKAGDWLRSEAQKVMVAAAQSGLGTKILNMIGAIDSHQATGEEKMNSLVSAAIGLGEAFLSGGGWSGVFHAVVDFVRGIAQMLFADYKVAIAKVASGATR